ncbi:MAG TPA: hypothetical protein VFQ68_02605 [Streptosporangiaceae bacterium]|nr:hypothetical protein [Streptosporangiaceae bacterium]
MIVVAALAIAAAGLIAGMILLAIGMVRGLGTRPRLITPSAYRDEREKAKPARTGEFKLDKAWPLYPFRQAEADLGQVWDETSACYQAIWRGPRKAFYSDLGGSPTGWWVVFPIPLAITGFLVAAGFSLVVLFVLFALISLGCVAVAVVVGAPVAGLLLGLEAGRRRLARTQASCPRCFHVTEWPAYRCPGCSILHRDLRPGRQGLIMRRCECGTLLPTMPLRAAWRLKAACQRCRKPLPSGAGAVRDLRISVFGDTEAGKTRFLHAALGSLMVTAERAGIDVSFPDQSSRDQAGLALDRLGSGQDTPRTPGNAHPALTVRLGTGARATLTHLFDTAGEHFRDPEMHDSLGFLGHSHGLVYVIDPYSIETVRRHLPSRSGRHGVPVAADPEAAYGEVVERLRDSGVPAGQQRLAVVVSKADLLRSAGLGLPAESDLIADWLTEAGAHNLVLSARREFAQTRFFTVASQLVRDHGGPDDPGAPVRWLLRSHGVRLAAGGSSGHRPARRPLGETAGARS